MLYQAKYRSPFGMIQLSSNGFELTELSFTHETADHPKSCEIIDRSIAQLDEYFGGKRRQFDIPLSMQGTSFQIQVWKALLDIPYGQTRSYSDIAEQIGNPKACRAVGMANNRNKIAIIIPCHRVIGKNGSLVGYAGGLDFKQHLLKLEHYN